MPREADFREIIKEGYWCHLLAEKDYGKMLICTNQLGTCGKVSALGELRAVALTAIWNERVTVGSCTAAYRS